MNLGVALERADIPILLISGWQDLFLDQTLEQYRRLHERGVDVAATIGPWSHIAVGAGAARITTDRDVRLDRGAPRRAGPPQAAERGAHLRDRAPTSGATCPRGRRRRRPPPSTCDPHRDLSAEPPGDDAPASSFLFDPARPTPTIGGPLLGFRCVKDDTELGERADVACWTTPVLDHDLEVLGTPVVELAHASDNPYVDLFARISEIGRRRALPQRHRGLPAPRSRPRAGPGDAAVARHGPPLRGRHPPAPPRRRRLAPAVRPQPRHRREPGHRHRAACRPATRSTTARAAAPASCSRVSGL